ncbi:MAG: DNA polymerase I [Bacteroidaceae bacterium]|nr:DNA polymerase I [Bacteroidaceae bacterium]
MEKLFLLDAYALIYRAYYAFIKNPRINSKGMNTSAIFGFVNTLADVIKRQQPTHLGVAFDPAGPTFRHEAFEQYKAQREETPEDIRLSVPIIKEIIAAYRIPILEVAGYEADDVIGTLATTAGAQGIDTYMMTPDKDYGQLVGEHVFMYRPRFGDKDFDTLGVEEVKVKFGISRPEQVIDLLGLMGDSSDNIPGCPGVGEKTALKLITEFDSIENLLANTDQLKGALKKKVEENAEQIRFSRFLATIKTDVPIELDMESLRLQEPDEEKLRTLFEELEFRNLADRVLKPTSNATTPAPKKAAKKEDSPTLPFQGDLFAEFEAESTDEPKYSTLAGLEDAPYNYQLADTKEKRAELLRNLRTRDFLVLDTETTGTEPMASELVGMSFSVNEGEAWYVPVPANRDEATAIVGEFRDILTNPKVTKVGQNIKYDLLMLAQYGVWLEGPLFDTMVAHYVLSPELHHGMDYLAEVLLHYRTIRIEELIGPKGKNQKNMRDLAPEEIYKYACEDADITLRLKNILEKQLHEQGAYDLFHDIEMPLVPVLAQMEFNGVRIDTDALRETSALYTQRLQEIEQDIYALAGQPFNISSPKQVGEMLFDTLKISAKAKKTKGGQYSTSEEVLESLRDKHPVVGRILDYRGLKKLLSTYIDALPALINPRTGRIHTSFNQTITATGRLSSSNPNLQNIPIRHEDGREIRRAFIPDDGCEFFSADYSQIELRIMAHLSGDAHMMEAFRLGQDIHAATAAKVYKVPLAEVTREQRSKAKTANFGIIYGISAYGLSDRMHVPVKEAKELIDGYFQTYPQVKAYMDGSIALARDKGYTETICRRRCYLPDINSHNAVVRGYAERNAINAPIQGSAADIIKVAMANIHQRFRREGIRSKMLIQVHDELNFSVLPEERDRVQRIVIEEMEGAYLMQVPLQADCGWGKNWLEAH